VRAAVTVETFTPAIFATSELVMYAMNSCSFFFFFAIS
jgi:hypothetical protein